MPGGRVSLSGASKLRRESSVNRGKSDTESISVREGEVLADLPGQLVKQDPVLLEFADDRLLFCRRRSRPAGMRRARQNACRSGCV
jgi:hypothetical protein